jgi:hypothetical protein
MIGLGLGLKIGGDSGVAPFTPASRGASLLLWSKADDPNIVTSGGLVQTWPDLSGNGNTWTDTTGLKAPLNNSDATLNNKKSVGGGAGGQQILTSGLSTSQANTIYLVGYLTAGTAFVDGTVNRQTMGNNAGTWFMNAGVLLSGGASDANPHAFAMVWNGASSKLFVDNSAAANASGNAGANAVNLLELSGASGFSGAIAEIAVMSGADSQAQVAQMFAYFAGRGWGINPS